jgi:hypothetical protein
MFLSQIDINIVYTNSRVLLLFDRTLFTTKVDSPFLKTSLLKNCSDDHIFWQDRRQIFQRVNDEVNLPLLQPDLQLFREQTLFADLVQGNVQDLIAGGGHGHDLEGQVRIN